MPAGVQLTMFGKRFGSRTVISEPFKHASGATAWMTRTCVVMRCDCGRDDIVVDDDLLRARSQCSSCMKGNG